MIKAYLKKHLSVSSQRKLRNIMHDTMAFGFGINLDRLGRIYKTDKSGVHFYTPHYQLHFSRFKYKQVKLLEIGVGGYDNPEIGGHSLRMWKKYFPFGRIFALDIYDKSPLKENRINIYKGSQVDKEFLDSMVREIGELDIIIDDGSHINEHVIETFKILFPKLKDGGIYVVEDTQTSYWKEFGGDSENLDNPSTMLNYFKRLTDCLNYKELIRPGYQPTYYDQKIISMHFYHNLVFIYKGDNNEESNVLRFNQYN